MINYTLKIIFVLLFTQVLFIYCSSVSGVDSEFKSVVKESKEGLRHIDTNSLERKAREFYIKGANYWQQRKYADAALEYQEALKYDSSSVIFYSLAKCYKELNKYDLALENSIISFEKNPRLIQNLELISELYILKFQLDNAIATYKQILTIEPTIDRKLDLARLYEYKDINKAIEIYENILKEEENYIALVRLSSIYKQTKNEEKNYETNLKIFYQRPGTNSAITIITFLMKQKKYEEAIGFLNEVDHLLESEELVYCYGSTADLLFDDTTNEANTVIFNFLKKIDNRFHFEWRLQILAGYLADRIQDSLKTDEFFYRALNLIDTVAEVPIQIALFYIQKGKNLRSIEILKNFESQFSYDHRFPLFIGVAYLNLDSLVQSRAYLRKSFELDSAYLETLIQLGIVYDRSDIHDSSDYYYQRGLAIEPGSTIINNNYAYSLCLRNENLQEAMKMSKLALDAEPDNAAYLDTYGWINFQLGEIDTALKYVSKAAESSEASSEVFEHLGDIYIKLNQHELALQAWQKALILEPNRASVLTKLNQVK